MKIIKEYVDMIDEELEGSLRYAEMYIEYKSKSDGYWYDRFKEMALDELKHAEYIHELATKKIEHIRKVYIPTSEMQIKWNESHANYIERAEYIKQLLSM